MSATVRRRRLLPGRRGLARVPRPGPRGLIALLVVAAILVGAFFWVRQSSLVAVRRVTITGVGGPDVVQIRSALTGAAQGMSTLDLDRRRLTMAVASFSVVRGLRLHADPPHGLRIAVAEQVPVAVVVAGATRTTVDTDGAVLHGSAPSGPLPTIAVSAVPGGTHVTGEARSAVAVLAAAPYAFIARIASATDAGPAGLAVVLRNGPRIVFGSDAQLAAKWQAAVAVLASASSVGASYIDVTVPSRPAAGTGSDGGSSTSTASDTATSQPGESTPN